jgi:hypothetical protein
MAFKVFTNGSTLQASEVNDNLMRQAVATFSNAAARTAAITAPSEGMLTYLEDVDRYDHWNGSAWVSPFGMTFLNRTTFTSATTVSVNNVFSSLYDNYKIFLRVTSSSANSADVNFRMRSSGTDFSSNVYLRAVLYYGVTDTTALAAVTGVTSTFGALATSSDVLGAGSEVNVFSPFLTQRTAVKASAIGSLVYEASSHINSTNSFDGFTIYPNVGNITGNFTVYGMRR